MIGFESSRSSWFLMWRFMHVIMWMKCLRFGKYRNICIMSVFFLGWERSLETCSRRVGCLRMYISLHLCVDLVHVVMCVYMYVWDIIQVTYFVSEQIGHSYQTEDRSQLITCDLMYLNILKRLFFLSIKSLIRPPPQQPAACAGKTWINWKWVCSSGEISFFLAGPVPRERFRVTGQPPATHRGWICANHFLHLMGGIARRSGGHPQNSTFWSCEGLRDFSKTFVSLCGENSDEQILLNFNR